ncbi:MAG: beta-galactosidase [Planctomycetota bacterium]
MILRLLVPLLVLLTLAWLACGGGVGSASAAEPEAEASPETPSGLDPGSSGPPPWTSAFSGLVQRWVTQQRAEPEAFGRIMASFGPAQLRQGDRGKRAVLELSDQMEREAEALAAGWRSDPGSATAMPAVDWTRMRRENGRWTIDGRPVFPLGFSWFDEVENFEYHVGGPIRPFRETLRPILDDMAPLGVGLHEINARVSAFVTGNPAESRRNAQWLRQRLDLYAQYGMAADVNLIWNHTQPLEARYPGLTRSGWHFFRMDIDHPDFRGVAGRAIDTLFGTMGPHPALAGVSLANEPEFPVTAWTEHTVAAFATWLEREYGEVDSLNQAWGTELDSFRAVTAPTKESLVQASSGRHYDTLRFNRHRATQAFAFLADRIRRHHPDIAVHIKIQDLSSVGVQHHVPAAGIDREAMAEIVDFHGIDTRILPVTDDRAAADSWKPERYCVQWPHAMLAYDHLLGVGPGKAILDTEVHAFTTGRLRPRADEISAEHAPLSMWLMAGHGSTGNIVWYWQRRDNPELRHPALSHAFFRSVTARPALLAALFQSHAELNKFGPEVAAVADPSRPIRVLFSDSSWMIDHRHMHALHTAYEAAAQLGVGVGVASESILARGKLPDETRLLLVPGVTHLTADAQAAIAEAELDGLAVVWLDPPQTLRDPYGRPLNLDRSTLGSDWRADDAVPLHAAMARALGRLDLTPAIRLVRADDPETMAFGTLYRSVEYGGDTLSLIAHVGSAPSRLRALGPDGQPRTGTDLRTGDRVEGEIELRPRRVALVRWD